MVSRLVRLALIRRVAREWKLTPLGRQRLEAMPAAPLLGRASSIIADILGHYIPIAHATGIVKPEEPAKLPAAFDFGEREPRRILVAEDSYLQARALSDFLRSSGYDVVGPAARLGEAMTLSRQPLEGALLDIDLGGERSFALAATLVKRRVPTAFISGYSRSILDGSPELGAIPFLSKPLENDALIATLKTFAA